MKKFVTILFFVLYFYHVNAQISTSEQLSFYFNFWSNTDSINNNSISFENIDPYNGNSMPQKFNMNMYISCPDVLIAEDSINDFEVSLVLKFKLGNNIDCIVPLNPRLSKDSFTLISKKIIKNNDLKSITLNKDTLINYHITINNIEILNYEKEYNKRGLFINQLVFYIYVKDIKTKDKNFFEYVFPICCIPQECNKGF